MRIDLDRLKEVFRTKKGRRIILAVPIAVTVNILVLILFLGVGGKETSALEGTAARPGASGKHGSRGTAHPVRPQGLGPLSSAGLAGEGTETVAGRVVTEEGRSPLAGALVRIASDLSRDDDDRTEWAGPFVANGKGQFRIEGLRYAPYRLRASAPGRLDAEVAGVLPGHDAEIALSRDGGNPCRVEADNAPLSGQKVLLEIVSQGFSLEAETDRQGRFNINGLSRADVEKANEHAQIEILVPGYCQPTLVSSADGLVISVSKGITITGVVMEKATGRALPGATVRSGSGHVVETDGAGAYRITGVAGSLVALLSGYAPEGQDLMEVEVEGKESHKLDFHLERGMSLHGRVTDRQGRGLAEVKVAVLVDVLDFTLNDRRLEESVKDLLSSTTDGAGNYRITGLPAAALNLPGTLSLELRPPGLGSGLVEDVEVQAEEGDVERSIVLDLAGSLTGTITGADGRPVIGAKLSLQPMEDGVAQVAASDRAGGFAFGNLPAGNYRLEVEAEGQPPFAREIAVPSEPLQLRLPR